MSGGFLLAGTRDGGASSKRKRNPSTNSFIPPKPASPIFVNVQVNNKRQSAIIDTGSAVTIINQQLLKKIYHKEFIHKHKLHRSANCTSINIIGEIRLEIKIQGHRTLVLADVATNLITDLLLGNDWITQNNVIIDSLQQHIFLADRHHRILAATPFIDPPEFQSSVLLTDEITLAPYSERCIDVKFTSTMNNNTEALFEPAPNLYPKRILLTNAILKVENKKSRIMIINANDRQRTLSKNTTLGYISNPFEWNNHLVLPVLQNRKNYQPTRCKQSNYERDPNPTGRPCGQSEHKKGKVRFRDFTCDEEYNEEQKHQCYVCQERFLTRNDLQQHLRQKCYPQDIREQIEKLTSHIKDQNQRQKLQHILWKHGKLLDLRQSSTIKATVHHAIETGTHPPVFTPPYRVSYKDERIQRD